MKTTTFSNSSIFFRKVYTARSLTLGLLLVCAGGCGGKSNDSDANAPNVASGVDASVTPLVASVADGCGIETYVGPDRGYSSPYVNAGVWHGSYEYSSGLGYEGTSGFSEHSTSTNGEIQHDPRCLALQRAFQAQPLEDGNTSERKYDLELSIDVKAEGFPSTGEEARRLLSIATQQTATLNLRVMKPCQDNRESCWQVNGLAESFPVELQCSTNPNLIRANGTVADSLSQDGVIDLYSMAFPDQCSFAVRHATIALADGTKIQASLAGTVAKEAQGSFLRIKRISIEQ